MSANERSRGGPWSREPQISVWTATRSQSSVLPHGFMNSRNASRCYRPACGVIRVVTLLVSCLLTASPAFAQASVNVSSLDPVYRDIQKLIAHDLVDAVIVGQRPYSRIDIARIAAQARRNLPRLQVQLSDAALSPTAQDRAATRLRYVESILSRIEGDYSEELDQLNSAVGVASQRALHPIARVEASVAVANSPPRDAINANLGFNDAVVNPLLRHRQGRNVVDGGTASVETVHWTRVSRHIALFARPRFQISRAFAPQPNINEVKLQNLYASVVLGNIEVLLGRDNLAWGHGRDAGLLISSNARGMDMIKISNDRLLTLPWLLRLLGPTKFSLFVAHLGSNRHFPNSYMVGYKISVSPHAQLELGFAVTTEAGGRGAPTASLFERIVDPLIFVDIVFFPSRDLQFSDKRAEFDASLRFPQARGLELFAAAVFDDIRQANLKGMFTQDAGYVVGAYLPRLVDSGRLDLTLQYYFTGIRLYRHKDFRSGHTLDGILIGSELESTGRAGNIRLSWDASRQDLITLEGTYEARSADDYMVLGVPPGDTIPLQTIKLRSNPQERRYRAAASWTHRLRTQPILIKTLFGYERANTFGFQLGRNRNNLVGEIQLQLNY